MSCSSSSSGMPAGTISKNKLISSEVFARSMLYALQQIPSNFTYPSVPSTYAISGVNTNGARSRLIPNFDLKFPKKWPKSMWNKWPDSVTMMLSECRSPIPRTSAARTGEEVRLK